ncbi:hypothetical protein [Tritonibacter sp. SIMBA_163]|uniref:hypothetical protein n=1 Tax=Tritonibacter sp. SIMBA_163 TaxID=3080868 RepID=UPI00397EC071
MVEQVDNTYLGNLLEDGWVVVGYDVSQDEAVRRHHVLVQKGARLRSYSFDRDMTDKINPDAGVRCYNLTESVIAFAAGEE